MSDSTAVEPAAPAGALAVPDDVVEGLEDVEQSDLVMPFLRIDHDNGCFVDNLSGESYPAIEPIALGLIKQRILWPDEVGEGDQHPLCRSFNFKEGHPHEKDFPWESDTLHLTKADLTDGCLTCADCGLKEWGSHPKRDTPWCSEQHTFALLLPVGDDGWTPSLLTLQRSAIKPSKTYLTYFANAKQPLFTVRTKISLDQRRRGNVDFAVPKFVRGEATDQSMYPFFSQTLREIREFVQTPRFLGGDEQSEVAVSNPAPSGGAAPAQSAPASTPPEAAASKPATPPDDDLPF